MKALHFLFAVLLAISAVLQFNDPDPVYWVAVYGCAALVPVMHIAGRRSMFFVALTIGMILSGLIYAVPGFVDYLRAGEFAAISGSMDGPAYVEPAREFLGLTIALAIVGVYALRWRPN
jgi:hypothetical protein